MIHLFYRFLEISGLPRVNPTQFSFVLRPAVMCCFFDHYCCEQPCCVPNRARFSGSADPNRLPWSNRGMDRGQAGGAHKNCRLRWNRLAKNRQRAGLPIARLLASGWIV